MRLQMFNRHVLLCLTVADADNVIPRQLTPEILSAFEGVRFIAQHIKDADKDNEVRFLLT